MHTITNQAMISESNTSTRSSMETSTSDPRDLWVPKGMPSTQKKRILLIDDEPLVRNVQMHILESAGFEVVIARDGHEGVEIYKREIGNIDLVVLDYTMPGMNGMETWLLLRDLDPEIRVIFCSGNCPPKEVTLMLARGVRGYVQKPFLIADFIPAINRALED